MEAQNKYDSSYHSATNWTIVGGSLVNSVTFESSSSPSDGNGGDENAFPKSPLVMCPPSPDSNPCEITITFAQKHEVRQVYVRSSARVYEIYYATQLESSNEYLCTVRCGIATRDEEVIHTTGIEETALAHVKGSVKDLDERELKNDSNASTNEGDWVEVKAPDASLLDTRNNSLPSNLIVHPERSTQIQDLYEATAEMSDADPCNSITLQLLSLQSRGCLFVDEVYVFADPVDSADSENQIGQMENSAGSSLMAMLVPTLFQLSKTRDVSRMQDKQIFDARGKQKQETGLKAIESTNIVNKIVQEEKPNVADWQEGVGTTVKHDQLETSLQVSGTESKPGLLCSHVERVLDQLVSRVSRIENLFLRFEENMLKPINGIDTRLQQVEQKLEEVTKKSQNAGLPSCTRIFAPEFSCHESDHNSSFINGNNNSNSESFESDKEDFSLDIPTCDVLDSSSASQSLPGLVVTAPEFVNADDEEENRSPGRNSPEDRTKKSVPIDDALASALAGFLSSTSIEPRKYTQALAVKAPKFSSEEDGDYDNKALPNAQCEKRTDPSAWSDETEGIDYVKDSVSTASCISSIESERKFMRSLDDHSERTVKGFDEQCLHNEGVGDSIGTVVDCTVARARHDVAKNDSFQLREDFENEDASNETCNNLVPNEADILNQSLGNWTENGSDTTWKRVVGSGTTAGTKLTEESNKDVLHTVLKFSDASTLVDFEIPILDVKFNSQGNSSTSLIEALLADLPVSTNETASIVKSVDGSKQCNFMDDGELTGPPTDTLFSVDMNCCNLTEMPLDLEGEKQHDHYACINQEMPAASFI